MIERAKSTLTVDERPNMNEDSDTSLNRLKQKYTDAPYACIVTSREADEMHKRSANVDTYKGTQRIKKK